MPLYIHDAEVADLAEQLRVQLGVRTKTEAVRTALRNELERIVAGKPLRERLAEVRARARAELGPPVHVGDMKKLMDDLWEDNT